MSRTQDATDLCTLIVRDVYGELTSRLFALLSRRGRQPVSGVVHHTRLTTREVRHGLAVLLQQNLVYYHLDSETGITHYEANQDSAYLLLRSGKILRLIEAKFGTVARDLVKSLLLLGHTKVTDLIEAYNNKRGNPNAMSNGSGFGTSLSNGSSKDSNGHTDSNSGRADGILIRLLEAGFVEVVTEVMFRSPADIYNDVEKEILENSFPGGIKGTKQKEELRGRIVSELRAMRSDVKGWQRDGDAKLGSIGVHSNGAEKRRKLSNGSGSLNGYIHVKEENDVTLDPDLIVRINYEKCNVAMRSAQLVAVVNKEIGEITSQVYAELLRLLEEKIPRCRLDPTIDDLEDSSDGPSLSTLELYRALPKNIKISSGIGKASEDKIDTRVLERNQKKRKRMDDDVDDIANSDDEEREDKPDDVNEYGNIIEVDQDSDSHGEDLFMDPAVKSTRLAKVTFQDRLPKPPKSVERHDRSTQVKKHLLLLAEAGHHFVRRCGSRGMGEWTVDFDRVVEYIRETEVDSYICQAFGASGLRIIRILRSRGKLDEKQLQRLSLMKQKDVRTKLAEMQMSGFVDIQEVPKDNNRTLNRTMYLWYFDVERVTMIVLDIIYKTMTRHLQELEVQKYHHLDVVSLAERSDVRGQEEDMLTASQFRKLQEVRETEMKLMAQISRLDSLVGVFRDF